MVKRHPIEKSVKSTECSGSGLSGRRIRLLIPSVFFSVGATRDSRQWTDSQDPIPYLHQHLHELRPLFIPHLREGRRTCFEILFCNSFMLFIQKKARLSEVSNVRSMVGKIFTPSPSSTYWSQSSSVLLSSQDPPIGRSLHRRSSAPQPCALSFSVLARFCSDQHRRRTCILQLADYNLLFNSSSIHFVSHPPCSCTIRVPIISYLCLIGAWTGWMRTFVGWRCPRDGDGLSGDRNRSAYCSWFCNERNYRLIERDMVTEIGAQSRQSINNKNKKISIIVQIVSTKDN